MGKTRKMHASAQSQARKVVAKWESRSEKDQCSDSDIGIPSLQAAKNVGIAETTRRFMNRVGFRV